ANQPKGSFDGPYRSTMLDANDQIKSVEEYENLLINWNQGAPVRLKDIARVVNGAEDRLLAAWADSKPAVLVNSQRQPGANVADGVLALMPQLISALPTAVEVTVLTDRTHSIRGSIRDVQKELIFAVCLGVLVTFVFVRTVPATIIPSVAVPLSLVGTFGVMY